MYRLQPAAVGVVDLVVVVVGVLVVVVGVVRCSSCGRWELE